MSLPNPEPEAVRLLLVEDNPGDARLIRELLSEMPRPRYGLRHATRLSDVAGWLEPAGAIDLVLLDLSLPDAGELEGLKTVRRVAPRIPVIVLTGTDDEELAVEAVRQGAQDYLVKGQVDGALLSIAIQHALTRANLVQRLERAVERARAGESNLRNIVTASVDGVLVLGPDDDVRFLNATAAALVGPEVQVGGHFPGAPSPGEEREHPLGGRQVELRTVAITWEQQPARMVSLRDVTDRRRAEALQHRLVSADRTAAVGRLAAGIAHEINNPSTFVMANLECMPELLDRLQSGQAPQALAALRALIDENLQGMERVRSVAHGLATFSAADRSTLEALDLNAVVEASCALVRNELRTRARLEWSPGDIPPVRGNRARLTQAVTDLLVHTAQAIPEGAASRNCVRVSTQARGSQVLLVVEDPNRELSGDQLQRMFEPFSGEDERAVNAGLGLSPAAEIARQHEGDLRAEGGQGVRMTLTLPAVPRTTRAPQTAPREGMHGLRVLVVDDEPILLSVFSRMIAATGATAVPVEGGRAALSLLSQDDAFDVVLCDVMMPDVSGPDVLQALQERGHRLAERVIFCTGGAFTTRMSAFIARLERPVLYKPFTMEQLRQGVQHLLGPS